MGVITRSDTFAPQEWLDLLRLFFSWLDGVLGWLGPWPLNMLSNGSGAVTNSKTMPSCEYAWDASFSILSILTVLVVGMFRSTYP